MADRISFACNTPLLPQEDANRRAELRHQIAEAIKPNDILEEFWVDDLTHQVWDVWRYRAMTAAVVKASMQRGLQRVLEPILDSTEDVETPFAMEMGKPSERLAHDYFAGGDIERVNEVLKHAGLDWEIVQAEAMSSRQRDLQHINQFLAKAEARRAATLRALERHREGLGAQLQSIAKEFEEAEGDAGRAKPVTTKLAA